MVFNISNSIQESRKMVSHLKNDGRQKSIGDIWSLKKLLLLEYYLPSFKQICSPRNNFNSWYYADPFCGSGLFSFKDKDLKNEVYPGSSLIGAILASKFNFTDCIFSELNPKFVKILNERLEDSKHLLNKKMYKASIKEFTKAADDIAKFRKYRMAILVFIDPVGYKDIKWESIEKLFKLVGVDVILNFMTYTIALNVSDSKNNSKKDKNLTEFFGDDNWKKFRTVRSKNRLGEKLLEHYLEKVRRISKKNTIVIGVYKEKKNKLYDLIVVTRSPAGTKVIKEAQDIMNNSTTKSIKSEFKVQLEIQKTLFG